MSYRKFIKENSALIILYGVFLFLPSLISGQVNAQNIAVTDDMNHLVKLKTPAKKVVSLSPHTTEILYAAGATQQIVAAVEYSDYPQAARSLPRVGSGYQLDIESIVAMQPDLIVGWQSGNSQAQLQLLKKMGFVLYLSEPKTLADIADNLRDMGQLLGSQHIAEQEAVKFLSGISALKEKYQQQRKVTVFYQVWQQPLFTINGEHIISHIIKLCGGENVFKDLSVLSPQVSIESVISKNPDVIVVGAGEAREDWLVNWEKWSALKAVKNRQLYGIDADLIVRHSPRILQGANEMCEVLQKARKLK